MFPRNVSHLVFALSQQRKGNDFFVRFIPLQWCNLRVSLSFVYALAIDPPLFWGNVNPRQAN
jgi:hypothetical protein